ncbi:MAG: glycosyltransferase family 9 protein [Pedosphaera sp.]|nr:glycosyltransferase family 9 protein [Pedosphaera sp.]
MKPKLLIIELWGLGDLIIATPFIRAASEKFDVTVVAKPYARDLQSRFWPGVNVLPFVAPWTAFKGKYRLHRWPWRGLYRLRKNLLAEKFDIGLAARWDPRDHILLWLAHTRRRLGFPRLRSQMFLTEALANPDPREHRFEYWRVIARALELKLPPRDAIPLPVARPGGTVLVHSGAGQPVRVWPLPLYRELVARLRKNNFPVVVACDDDQRDWWLQAGERDVATPREVTELMALLDRAGAFIGNDSGPGHLAAFCGVPTLTLFGPQLPEWFAPLHPDTLCLEGRPCPYKPCSDYCRFAAPHCLTEVTVEEVWKDFEKFLRGRRDPRALNGG